jgi:hypothetical protein
MTTTKYVAGWYLGLCLAVAFLSQEASAQQTLVLISNHDVELLVAGEAQHVTNQVKVRNTRTFPIEFHKHRIDINILNIGDGKYHATMKLLEQADSGWIRITTDDLSFEAMYGAPIQYQWQAGDISFDLAIAVSIFQQ